MKYILFIFIFLNSTSVFGQISNYSEKQIADYIESLIGGKREVIVKSGRIDLVHNSVAFEIEWANKWKESIGQSLWYAQQSNNEPGIILIIRDEKDYKFFIQLNSTLQYSNLDKKIKVYLFPDDFKEFMEKDK